MDNTATALHGSALSVSTPEAPRSEPRLRKYTDFDAGNSFAAMLLSAGFMVSAKPSLMALIWALGLGVTKGAARCLGQGAFADWTLANRIIFCGSSIARVRSEVIASLADWWLFKTAKGTYAPEEVRELAVLIDAACPVITSTRKQALGAKAVIKNIEAIFGGEGIEKLRGRLGQHNFMRVIAAHLGYEILNIYRPKFDGLTWASAEAGVILVRIRADEDGGANEAAIARAIAVTQVPSGDEGVIDALVGLLLGRDT